MDADAVMQRLREQLVFARRTRVSTSLTVSRVLGSLDEPVGVGQVARCTEPSCHQLHTSSVTNGRIGANRRSMVESALRNALDADAAASSPRAPYARLFTNST